MINYTDYLISLNNNKKIIKELNLIIKENNEEKFNVFFSNFYSLQIKKRHDFLILILKKYINKEIYFTKIINKIENFKYFDFILKEFISNELHNKIKNKKILINIINKIDKDINIDENTNLLNNELKLIIETLLKIKTIKYDEFYNNVLIDRVIDLISISTDNNVNLQIINKYINNEKQLFNYNDNYFFRMMFIRKSCNNDLFLELINKDIIKKENQLDILLSISHSVVFYNQNNLLLKILENKNINKNILIEFVNAIEKYAKNIKNSENTNKILLDFSLTDVNNINNLKTKKI